MAGDDGGEKTEEASDRQVQRFRERGQIAQSKELIAAVTLVVGTMSLIWTLPFTGRRLLDLIRDSLLRAATADLTTTEVGAMTWTVLSALLPAVLFVLVPAAVAAIVTGVLETGFNFTTQPLEPDFSKIDPFSAFQNMFMSRQPWVQLVKGALICVALLWASWAGLRPHLDRLNLAATWSVAGQSEFLMAVVWDVLQRALPVTVAIGAADYMYQRWNMSEQMKMTKQEVKMEHKDQDGNPQLKGKRRQRARQLAMGLQISNVKRADVVVTNPTHFAVALRYRKEENQAPVVIARGVDHLALRIRKEAARHDIPTIENRPLARALYAQSRSGQPIPAELFGPVAQVLAVVYRRRKRKDQPA